ncbi:hypothetical protein GXP64_20095 [Rhodovulum sulfidophilum]|nr:hypothetical protein [Rhodovulum sulfidophilum]
MTITDLSEEQLARFGGSIEWLNTVDGTLFTEANPAGIDAAAINAALRVTFIGQYDPDEDDFTGITYFTRSLASLFSPLMATRSGTRRLTLFAIKE